MTRPDLPHDLSPVVRHLEAAYLTMWQRHLRGEPPADFAVEPIESG